MLSIARELTLDEFRTRDSDEDEVEFWHGEAVSRSVGTWLHSATHPIWAGLFCAAAYKTEVELELRISPTFQPEPDVAADLRMQRTYPTRSIVGLGRTG